MCNILEKKVNGLAPVSIRHMMTRSIKLFLCGILSHCIVTQMLNLFDILPNQSLIPIYYLCRIVEKMSSRDEMRTKRPGFKSLNCPKE